MNGIKTFGVVYDGNSIFILVFLRIRKETIKS